MSYLPKIILLQMIWVYLVKTIKIIWCLPISQNSGQHMTKTEKVLLETTNKKWIKSALQLTFNQSYKEKLRKAATTCLQPGILFTRPLEDHWPASFNKVQVILRIHKI